MVFIWIITIFVLYSLFGVFLRFRKQQIGLLEGFFWVLFWFFVLFVLYRPDLLNKVADVVGIGRGVDVLVYLSILFLFSLSFTHVVSMKKTEQTLVKLARHIALKSVTKPKE